MTPGTALSGPDFVIVGSARSGTTLAQRLACELPSVGMPPETHFFDLFVPELLKRGPLPLDRVRLRSEVEHWRRMHEVRGMDVDVDAVIDDLGGSCTSLADFFGVLVRRLAPPSAVYGEKTPKHLLWWRQLARARPGLKVVAIVRDPRSVVASTLVAPWVRGISPFDWGDDLYVAVAERWRIEQAQTLEMARSLGRRCLVLGYESVVADPPAARAAIARLLGIDSSAPRAPSSTASIVLPWETWKSEALEDIDAGRTGSWRERLGWHRGQVIAAVCGPVMHATGYRTSLADRVTGAAAVAVLDPRTQRRRAAYRRLLRSELAWIDTVAL